MSNTICCLTCRYYDGKSTRGYCLRVVSLSDRGMAKLILFPRSFSCKYFKQSV